jgi:hypothetical protein
MVAFEATGAMETSVDDPQLEFQRAEKRRVKE